ncbi:MAG: acyl-CoA dehydrogenase family protein, partial [Acidobacteria bacterium]|nr:acyl-CoA dehydrogenase family protein [Acidobacteriota bacterium]
PEAIVEQMKEMGLFGITVPEEYGGIGESLMTYALTVVELARGWMSLSGVLNTHFMGCYLINRFGTDEQKQNFLPRMATGEIRVSILWEWLHKDARFTADDAETGVKKGDPFTRELFDRLLEEEYAKLLGAGNRDVHDDSKQTTLPIAREIVEAFVNSDIKVPWYIDMLNLNLNNHDLGVAKRRIQRYLEAFERDGTRITENPDLGEGI